MGISRVIKITRWKAHRSATCPGDRRRPFALSFLLYPVQVVFLNTFQRVSLLPRHLIQIIIG